MREPGYLDFDVLVERGSAGHGYRARVVTAPSGQTRSVDFAMPFSDLELENFLLKIGHPRRQAIRGLGSSENTAIRNFGGSLFDAVFHDDLRVALATSLDAAESQSTGLRLRLRLADVPELADVPWEYLYDTENRRFLALSEWTPLVRYLDLPGRIRPLTVTPPLNILVVVAGPTDFPPLDVNVEWEKLPKRWPTWSARAGSGWIGPVRARWPRCNASCAATDTTSSTTSATAATTQTPTMGCSPLKIRGAGRNWSVGRTWVRCYTTIAP
jgi:hypothetical protein